MKSQSYTQKNREPLNVEGELCLALFTPLYDSFHPALVGTEALIKVGTVLGSWVDLIILEVFSNLNRSMILPFLQKNVLSQ